MSHKKFDVDKFVDALELDEEIAASYDSLGLSNYKRDRKSTYRKCPRCGTRDWQRIYTNDYGKAECCDICKDNTQ